MIVDDDSSVLRMLTNWIKTWGYDPLPFGTFEDARAFLSVETPDALIVDVRLGKYNGLQLVHLARGKHPKVPVVAVSGYDDPVLRAAAADAGAAYLLKPAELPNLRDHLSAA